MTASATSTALIGAARRGGVLPLYRRGSAPACPTCDSGFWDVGRATAQCRGCGLVLDIADPLPKGPGTIIKRSAETWSRA